VSRPPRPFASAVRSGRHVPLRDQDCLADGHSLSVRVEWFAGWRGAQCAFRRIGGIPWLVETGDTRGAGDVSTPMYLVEQMSLPRWPLSGGLPLSIVSSLTIRLTSANGSGCSNAAFTMLNSPVAAAMRAVAPAPTLVSRPRARRTAGRPDTASDAKGMLEPCQPAALQCRSSTRASCTRPSRRRGAADAAGNAVKPSGRMGTTTMPAAISRESSATTIAMRPEVRPLPETSGPAACSRSEPPVVPCRAASRVAMSSRTTLSAGEAGLRGATGGRPGGERVSRLCGRVVYPRGCVRASCVVAPRPRRSP